MLPDAELEKAINAATKTGGLIAYRVDLENGESKDRRLWVRPQVMKLINGKSLEANQTARVKAALKRFIVRGPFTVVTAQCTRGEMTDVGDFRELKTEPPPFVELRFKPPMHELRFFGRFIGKDALVLTTVGMKSLDGKTGKRPLSVSEERQRCDEIFASLKLPLSCVPKNIRDSISNAEFA